MFVLVLVFDRFGGDEGGGGVISYSLSDDDDFGEFDDFGGGICSICDRFGEFDEGGGGVMSYST